jgi:hypothetical protein
MFDPASCLGFVRVEPATAIPVKLAEAMACRGDAEPLPPFPPELAARIGVEASADSKALTTALNDWVGVDDDAPKDAEATSPRQSLAQLIGVRNIVCQDLAAASKQLTPKQWVAEIMPRIDRYLQLLEFLAEHKARNPAYFMWHPSEFAINDVAFDAACVKACAGTCELNAAQALVARATTPSSLSDEDRRLAYRMLCSAAYWFEEAAASAKQVPTFDDDTRPVAPHPTLSSEFFTAMKFLSLAQAQEIAALRANVQQSDTTSLSRPCKSDSLVAALARQAAVLFTEAVKFLKTVPPPQSESVRIASASIFKHLESSAAAKSQAWSCVAHILVGRVTFDDDARRSMSHIAKARELATAAKGDTQTTTTTRRLCADACMVGEAIERVNALVSHAQPGAETLPLPTAKPLAHAKRFAI